jgi:hypothetical protein
MWKINESVSSRSAMLQIYFSSLEHAVLQLVEAHRYKSESRGFGS